MVNGTSIDLATRLNPLYSILLATDQCPSSAESIPPELHPGRRHESLPCGYYGDEKHECTSSMGMVQHYQKRISGPLLDLNVVEAASTSTWTYVACPTRNFPLWTVVRPSSAIRLRVEAAHAVQAERFRHLGKPGVSVNGDMGPSEVQKSCVLDDAGKNLMRNAVH